jgi:hypothetical protein
MNGRVNLVICRRDVVRRLALGTIATAASAVLPEPALADTEDDSEKRKARYRAHSPEVQTFYRVNRYPEM